MAPAGELGIEGGLDAVVCFVCLSMYTSACCGAESAAAATLASAGKMKLLSFISSEFFVGRDVVCLIVEWMGQFRLFSSLRRTGIEGDTVEAQIGRCSTELLSSSAPYDTV